MEITAHVWRNARTGPQGTWQDTELNESPDTLDVLWQPLDKSIHAIPILI
jgi:hypothetical protein